MKNTWYTAETGNHQGLIIDEQTGANIAVTYDKAHAPLIAAAPELLAALEGLRNACRQALPYTPADSVAVHLGEWIDTVNEVIKKAKGE